MKLYLPSFIRFGQGARILPAYKPSLVLGSIRSKLSTAKPINAAPSVLMIALTPLVEIVTFFILVTHQELKSSPHPN